MAAELVGAVAGLGQILNQAAQDIYPAMILVGMISVALCGWLMTHGSRLDRAAGHALEGDDVKPPRSLRSLPPAGAVSTFGTAGRC